MADGTRVDEWSKLLFNNVHVLRVSAAISSGGVETDCATLQREVSLGQTAVYRVIRTLERVNLLERTERSSQTQPLKYRRVNHPFWDAALELFSAAEGLR